MRLASQSLSVGITVAVLLTADMATRFVTAQQQAPAPDMLTVRELRLVDKDGHVRGVLNVDQYDASVLSLSDGKGKERVRLECGAKPLSDSPDQRSASLIMRNHDDTRVFYLTVGDSGRAELQFANWWTPYDFFDPVEFASLGVSSAGKSSLEFYKHSPWRNQVTWSAPPKVKRN